MNKTIQELNKTEWYRLLKVLYLLLLTAAIATSFWIGYENEGFYLWGYYFQFSLSWTIVALVTLYAIKRVFYYVHLGIFAPETNQKNLFEHWELSTAGIILILLAINWIAWRPSHIRIECHMSTTGAIYDLDNFEQRWDEEYPKYLKCLAAYGLEEKK